MSPINEHTKIPVEGFFPELGNATIDEKQVEDGTLEITFSKQVTIIRLLPAQALAFQARVSVFASAVFWLFVVRMFSL